MCEFVHRTEAPPEPALWPDEDYRNLYHTAGLEIELLFRPLARGDEGISWRSETDVSPWSIYVVRRSHASREL